MGSSGTPGTFSVNSVTKATQLKAILILLLSFDIQDIQKDWYVFALHIFQPLQALKLRLAMIGNKSRKLRSSLPRLLIRRACMWDSVPD